MPTIYCSVNNCRSNSTEEKVSFFSFPKSYGESWRRVVNREGWLPKKTSKICSRHFLPKDMYGREKRRRLKEGANPYLSFKAGIVQTGITNASKYWVLHTHIIAAMLFSPPPVLLVARMWIYHYYTLKDRIFS